MSDEAETPTGVFFPEQTKESIISAVGRFEEQGIDILPENCRKNAERFSKKRFCDEFRDYVMQKYDEMSV